MPTPRWLSSFVLCFALVGSSAASLVAQVVAYHNVSSASHQSQFNTLTASGYRLVSLSVAGDLSTPRYSAVWDQVGGPGWVSRHDMNQTDYIVQRSSWILQGYRAKLVTAAGSGSTTVYAAVFVNDGVSVTDERAVSGSNIASLVAANRSAGRIPVSIDIHGTAAYPLYCYVFEPNPTKIVWGCDFDANATEFATTRHAHGEAGERLACLGMSDSQQYVSVWYDERIGDDAIPTNQTSSGWQSAFTTWTGNGYYPRIVASGGSGSALRITGSFAEDLAPRPRILTKTGVYRSQFAAIDSYVTGLVQNKGRRAGAIAIAKDGRLVFARAINWTEDGEPLVQPTSSFRIASCTKPLIAIACHEADEQGLLSMATSPGQAIGLSYADPMFPNVDLRHLLEYTSGVVRNYDPVTVATWLNPSSPVLPTSLLQGAQWLAQQQLQFFPGTEGAYSNGAFLLAAEILRARSGQSYSSFLQNHVLSPLGITRMHVAPSEVSQLTSNDVRHQLTELVLLPSERYTDRRRRSAQYAEDLTFKGASGGWSSSVVDYVRFLSGVFDLEGPDAIVLNDTTRMSVLERHSYPKHDEPGETSDVTLSGMAWKARPGNVYAYSKGGWLPTNASSDICWRNDGVSWAVFFNDPQTSADGNHINDLIDAITSWPNVDEFPSYGLPAFPRTASVATVFPLSLNNVTTSYFTLAGEHFDTVTQVNFGSRTITSTSPTTWHDGYFVVSSPTSMRVYPPQGLIPTTYQMSLGNAAGTGLPYAVSITIGPNFRIGAPTVVNANQAYSAWIGRGTASGLTYSSGFGILCASFSNLPSIAPGIVSLELGNQFSDLVTSGVFQFGLLNSAYRFDLPPLPMGTIHLEAVGFDLAAPSLFPVSTTNMVSVTRQ